MVRTVIVTSFVGAERFELEVADRQVKDQPAGARIEQDRSGTLPSTDEAVSESIRHGRVATYHDN